MEDLEITIRWKTRGLKKQEFQRIVQVAALNAGRVIDANCEESVIIDIKSRRDKAWNLPK